MCRSCTHSFNGKYCQQCEFCGHPKHNDNLCGVGVIALIPYLDSSILSIGCLCKEERYERLGKIINVAEIE